MVVAPCQGRPGLLQLIADLMQQDDRRLQLERIRAWMEANGLKDFYARSIAQPARFPDVDAALASVGFELSESEAALTYLGIQVEGGDEEAQAGGRATSGRVVAVDPEGPAARAGVRVGDEIRGCGPARGRPPRVGKAVTTRYRFGLAAIASGAAVAELEVVRDGEELKVAVEVRLIGGGVRTAYRASGNKVPSFLEYCIPARER